jgi:hypothetical protein
MKNKVLFTSVIALLVLTMLSFISVYEEGWEGYRIVTCSGFDFPVSFFWFTESEQRVCIGFVNKLLFIQ